MAMTPSNDQLCAAADEKSLHCTDPAPPPVVVATMLRPNDFGGVHTHVQQVLSYLETQGLPGALITPYSWSRFLTYPVFAPRLVLERVSGSASVFWYRYWHEMFLRKALRRCLAKTGECVVYAQGPQEARAALRARRGLDQRVVMVVHYKVSQADEWVNRTRGAIKRDSIVFRMVRKAERETIPAVDGLIFVSEWARQGVLSWLAEASQVPYAVIVNFVTPMEYTPTREFHADLVNTSGLDLAKNHRYLLEILAAAREAGRLVTLDVFGDGPLREDLEQQASDLGIAEQVRFHGHRRDVREFLPGYRAFAHVSYAEASPFSIIEAMAAGLPVLAARIGGIPELYDDGIEGRYWTLDDPAAAAATLIELLDNESARAAAGQEARTTFRREFDSSVAAPRLVAFLYGREQDSSGAYAGERKTLTSFTLDSRLR
jgi:glycosyltransferase involved in cell wall biosynthesis